MVSVMEETAIRTLLTRLARPHASGGTVVERAAILAEGADFPEVMEWIVAHAGKPDTAVSAVKAHGLHGARMGDSVSADQRKVLRYVLPADALA